MPHRLRAGDTDEHVVEQRAEEQSKRAKLDKFLRDYGRIFLAIAVTVSTWFMSHVVAPLNQVPHLVEAQTKTDSMLRVGRFRIDSSFKAIDKKLDNAEQDRGRMVDILAVLAALQCDTFTIREQRTSRLCGKLLKGELP